MKKTQEMNKPEYFYARLDKELTILEISDGMEEDGQMVINQAKLHKA